MNSPLRAVDSRDRLVAAAGWAAVGWSLFQLAATRRESLGYWTGVVAINALPILLLGWATLRRFTVAAVALATYGVFRVYVAARVIMQRFDAQVVQPADWWVAPLAVPFAIVWMVGAIVAYRGWQRRRR